MSPLFHHWFLWFGLLLHPHHLPWWIWSEVYQVCLSFHRSSSYFHWSFLLILFGFWYLYYLCLLFFMISLLLLTLDFILFIVPLGISLSCFFEIFLVSWLSLYWYKLLSYNCFSASHRFWVFVVLFSFFSRYYFIFSLICSLTHWLFSIILFSYVFVFFAVFSYSLFLVQ